MMQKVLSTLQSIKIDINRFTDHMWRRCVGLPRMRNSQITSQIFLGGQYHTSSLPKLQQLGITGIVNMRLKRIHDNSLIPWASYLHLPTPDHHAPTLAQLEKGVDFITTQLKKGGKVYIHCAHGEGRGPTMVVAYLMSTGLTYDDALKQVQKVRAFARPTPQQFSRLKELEKIYVT
jgi:protein-tyrosine phosphatase